MIQKKAKKYRWTKDQQELYEWIEAVGRQEPCERKKNREMNKIQEVRRIRNILDPFILPCIVAKSKGYAGKAQKNRTKCIDNRSTKIPLALGKGEFLIFQIIIIRNTK